MPDDAEAAEVAHSAAVEVILSEYGRDEIEDLDVTASFDDGELTLDVYLLVPDADTADVVTEAIEAGTAAVDELFEEPKE